MAPTPSTPSQGTVFTTSSLKTPEYDVIFIGSGWAGRVAAQRVVAAGLTALVIEKELVGGDCPFWACVPSKALLRPSEALDAAYSVGGAKEQITRPAVDVSAVFARRNAFTRNWDDTKLMLPMTLGSGADVLRGIAKIVGEKKVTVTSEGTAPIELTARHAVGVCTGSVPTTPNVPGLKEAKPWGPREATSASTVPSHLVVIGAGAVGMEMATAYTSFGSQVTVIVHGSEILSKLDPKAGALVRTALETRGVKFHLNTTLSRVERKPDGSIDLTIAGGSTFTATEILVAAGRAPATTNLGLEDFSVPPGFLAVNDSMLVTALPNNNWLYAIGDVNGRSPLTHMCKYQGRIAGNTIVHLAKGESLPQRAAWDTFSATADHKAIPQVVFTQPAVTSVGITRAEAEKQGRKVRVVEAPLVSVGAMLHGDGYEEGWGQWVIDENERVLVGMTVVGKDVSELIHAGTVAIVGEVKLERLAHTVPCFPTVSEVYLNLADAAGL
ncbi:uncharacterized protein KY384_007945 [Bacidia gigantensis]|uniref:uncharacterized protein n=1 Tax=Bacidia gigantensis TaxID=2732470 RepID=UPI001D0509C7|nr:uncharacterized protein KY384_007945 [Bacidia gigantensis]KAG8527791.1 hypothetical protein KY384_007945 [Bacidia gigantensis]